MIRAHNKVHVTLWGLRGILIFCFEIRSASVDSEGVQSRTFPLDWREAKETTENK
jgi:hypothetical protein